LAERDAVASERDAAVVERDALLAQNDRLRHLLRIPPPRAACG
jgi:hypothetical protein